MLNTTVSLMVTLSIVGFSATALAAPQSRDQQGCLNQLTRAGAAVVRHQGKANVKCLSNAAEGRSEELGDPGETLTAQACLSNDVGGRVAKKQQRTIDKNLSDCQGSALPSFAYAGPGAINTAASSESREIVAAVFGPDLDAAVVDSDLDDDGARCQVAVLAGANRIVDEMWRIAGTGVKNGLSGRSRRSGAVIDRAAHSSDNLQGEILARILEDSKGKIQGSVDRLTSKSQASCASATTPLAQMFPGDCASAGNLAMLIECVADIARGRFHQSVEGVYAMQIECDLTDDGQHDGSCVSQAQQRHVLDRTAYGPDAYTVGRIQALGLNGYIDEQLSPNAIDDNEVAVTLASNYPSLALNVVEVRDCYPANVPGNCPGSEGGVKNDVWKEMEESEIYRSVASHRQLEAVLVDFWFNHFSVTGSTGQQKWNTPSYLRDSIRPWVLGDFEDSVLRMTRGPAMLDYLDQRQNQVGNPLGTGYNENFSRELLELHVMGVTAPYTENDVKEVARALTGWRDESNNEANFDPSYPGFRYDNNRHDYLGSKTVLGQIIPSVAGSGQQEGFTAISLAVTHPSTASFLCTKLVRRFVHDDPPFVLVDQCAAAFTASLGDLNQLRTVTELILKSKEFQLFPENRRSKVKRPVVLMASLLRAVGVDPDPGVVDYHGTRQALDGLGERIRNADPPTGYPDQSIVWASPGGIMQRFNLLETVAKQVAAGWGVTGIGTNATVVDQVIAVLFPLSGVSSSTRSATIAYLDSLTTATPSQKVEQAGALLLASPEFLTH